MPYADINGFRCFYTDEGKGPHTLLLMHGWGADSNDWIWLIPLLREKYRIVACDLRGHGHSSVPDDYALKRFVVDMVGLMHHVGCERFVPVGHSLGGAIAAVLSVQHAAMVPAMVAVDPAYGHEPDIVKPLIAGRERWKKSPEEGHALLIDLMFSAGAAPATPEFLKALNIRRIQAMPSEMVFKPYEGLADAPEGIFSKVTAGAYLSRRRQPVLSFHSLPGHAAWEKSILQHPYSKTLEWEGSGHTLQVERPKELASVMSRWLDGLPAS